MSGPLDQRPSGKKGLPEGMRPGEFVRWVEGAIDPRPEMWRHTPFDWFLITLRRVIGFYVLRHRNMTPTNMEKLHRCPYCGGRNW